MAEGRISPVGQLTSHLVTAGLVSETVFMTALGWELRRSERYWEPFLLALIEAGEPARARLATVLPQAIRGSDLAACLGDGRFGAILIKAHAEFLPDFANRLRSGLRLGAEGPVELSVGAAAYPEDGADPEALLQSAEAALFCARGEENGVYFHTHSQARAPKAKARILVVDDDAQNRKLLRACLDGEKYGVTEAEDGEQALRLLQKEEFDLVLLDVMMPGMSGFDVCRRLKSLEQTRSLPVILVTALDDVPSKVAGIEAGADDFLTKPFDFEELSARAASLIRLKGTRENMASVENVLMSLAAAVEAKDHYTQGHTDRAARLAMRLGQRLRLSAEEIDCLRIGGVLHDVGKIGVPESILNKAGPLTAEEWTIMKAHPDVGYRICESLSRTLGQALEVIRHHHEKLDGSSYPDGLKGDQITMVARIMGVVDIYDALVTDRPYRTALSHDDALEVLRRESKEGKLDGAVVEALIEEVRYR